MSPGFSETVFAAVGAGAGAVAIKLLDIFFRTPAQKLQEQEHGLKERKELHDSFDKLRDDYRQAKMDLEQRLTQTEKERDDWRKQFLDVFVSKGQLEARILILQHELDVMKKHLSGS